MRLAYYGRSINPVSDHYNAARYRSVNLHSWIYRGTVEFRVFNSSLCADRIATYIGLCIAVVQSARDGKSPKPQVRYKLGTMADGTVTSGQALDDLKASLFAYLDGRTLRGLDYVWDSSYPQSPLANYYR